MCQFQWSILLILLEKLQILKGNDVMKLRNDNFDEILKKSFNDCRFNVKNQKIFTTLEIPQKLRNKVFKELKHRKTELKK